MGAMVNLPQVRNWFDIDTKGSKIFSKVRADCTFMVYDVNGPGPVFQQIEMPDDSDEE